MFPLDFYRPLYGLFQSSPALTACREETRFRTPRRFANTWADFAEQIHLQLVGQAADTYLVSPGFAPTMIQEGFTIKHSKALLLAFVATCSISGNSQQIASSTILALPSAGTGTLVSKLDPGLVQAPIQSADQPLVGRWLDLKTLSYSGRYRNSVNADGRHMFMFGQDRYIAAGKFKFDKDGKYSINFHGSSGRIFNWAYADFVGGQYKDSVIAARSYKSAAQQTALAAAILADPDGAVYKLGFPSRGAYFYLRQLYVSATPVSQVTVEFGSLPIEHGQNTEITSFDDDGYISGERVRIHDPKHFFFDQIAGTWAFMGSTLTPNFFARGSDLKKNNYQQYLVEKKIGKRAIASVDFSELNGTHSMREAVNLKVPEAKVIDGARFELYQRMNDINLSGVMYAKAAGFAITVEKQLAKKLNIEAGFASVDNNYAVYSGSPYLASIAFGWNGDTFSAGKRGFAKVNWKLARGVDAFGFYTHTTATINPSSNIQGYNAGLNFDLKALANSGKRIF
jgi:hypothetical protein